MYFKRRLKDIIYECLKYDLAIFNYVPKKCVRGYLFPTILYKIVKIKQNKTDTYLLQILFINYVKKIIDNG